MAEDQSLRDLRLALEEIVQERGWTEHEIRRHFRKVAAEHSDEVTTEQSEAILADLLRRRRN